MSHSLLNNKSVLIVGGTGFIGRNLTTTLANHGAAAITVISRNAAPRAGDIEFKSIDVGDPQKLQKFASARNFDIIYNLSGKIDQSAIKGIYESQFTANTLTTIHLIEAFQGRTGRFIQIGSNAEYGDAPCPQSSGGPAFPCSAYGVTKLAASNAVLAKSKSENFPGLVARPYLVYGQGQNSNSFLGKAIEAAQKGTAFDTTAGEQTRDFTPVGKVAEELALLAQEAISCGKIYNLCTGTPITIREALCMLTEINPGFRPRFGAIPYRPTELMQSCGEAWQQWTIEKSRDALYEFLKDQVTNQA